MPTAFTTGHIGKTGIDLLVQPLNDFDGDALGRANPQP
jgi:hypothetical protein